MYSRFTCAKHDAARSTPERRHHPVLDRNVADMVILYVGRGFHFDETPSTVSASMQNIDAHEHAAVLEGAFKDRRDFAGSRLARAWRGSPDPSLPSLRTSTPPGNIWRASMPDLASLLDDRLCRSIRLGSQFRLVYLKVEPLEALAACDKLRFAYFDAHRSASASKLRRIFRCRLK